MEDFIANNPSVKRLLVSLLGVGTVALNKKFNLNLGDVEIEAIAAIILGFVGFSNFKAMAVAKAEAAGKAAAATVTTREQAVAVLNEAGKQ